MAKINYIEQPDEKDCGPTCLAMMSRYFGKKVSIAQLREYSGTDLYGTNILGMVKAGEKIGLELEGFEVEEIEEIPSNCFPAIFHIINDSGFDHFIIITKFLKNKAHIIDPAKGKYVLSKTELLDMWTKVILTVKPNEDFTKNSEELSIKKFYKEIFKKNTSFIFLIFIASILINGINILGAFYFQILIDIIIPSNIIHNLHIFSTGIAILYIISLVSSFLRYQLTLNMGIKISRQLMLNYYNHILRLPHRFFSTRKEGEILSRLSDTDHIREAVSSVTVSILIDSIMVIVGTIILFLQSPYLFFAIIWVIPIYIFLVLFFKKPFEKYNRQEMEANANLSSSFIEGIKGIDVIKSYTSENTYFKKTLSYFDIFLQKAYKLGTYTNIQLSLKEFMSLFTVLIVLWLGSYQVMEDKLSLGELLTFNALIVFYFNSIDKLLETQPTIQSAIVSTKRVLDILGLSKENNNKTLNFHFNKNIKFSNVSFRYGYRKKVLENLNFKINIGESIGIVGESGSGKSTIAKLLLDYYSIESGKITVDDQNLKNISSTSIRENISYVPQDNYIFFGTIIDNLTLGAPLDFSFDDIVKACKIAEAHDFIIHFPQGYNTMLESGGQNLSGGQIQRIAIARAILKNTKLIILDEATSALDSITESKILKNLKTINSTKIIISHKLRLTQNCNHIITMHNGKIIENGTHTSLLDNKSVYYNLWKNQKI
ncbi:peptidase domain-containing ABC transporter [Staphylococcus hominis]|uniref:peptidase domain-containing ABC transporter n=1 Tax=Staphylococcus hominis TaxID=1290 RepID=UPI000C795842|nr:peptidase domain-containing ABC transporter [Staphylococcus hominis]MCI2921924.1 peptidase domain-containing ABC transporter [Staphylococcus hominis]MDS3888287.1 peptidase domain-containing ABC transporter [Staphylococcus hominis]MDS3899176.1 peptidase domain-containing ABC transporter [Staphylococcus hominis]MDS3916590.1 peptidase domain-containing ABC transporter [Staphylococcus hominis]PLA22442.1 peptide cleavage/export ABC transporter [Staphylococcus hominis]